MLIDPEDLTQQEVQTLGERYGLSQECMDDLLEGGSKFKAQVLASIRKMKKLVDTPDKWLQGVWAKKANDENVKASSAEACKFCMSGALIHAMPEPEVRDSGDYLLLRERCFDVFRDKLGEQHGFISLYVWNDMDDRTHDDVLRLFEAVLENKAYQK